MHFCYSPPTHPYPQTHQHPLPFCIRCPNTPNPQTHPHPFLFLHPSQTPQNFTRIDIHSFFLIAPKRGKNSIPNNLLKVPSQTPHFRVSLNIHPWFLQPPKYTYATPCSNPLLNTSKFRPHAHRSFF